MLNSQCKATDGALAAQDPAEALRTSSRARASGARVHAEPNRKKWLTVGVEQVLGCPAPRIRISEDWLGIVRYEEGQDLDTSTICLLVRIPDIPGEVHSVLVSKPLPYSLLAHTAIHQCTWHHRRVLRPRPSPPPSASPRLEELLSSVELERLTGEQRASELSSKTRQETLGVNHRRQCGPCGGGESWAHHVARVARALGSWGDSECSLMRVDEG